MGQEDSKSLDDGGGDLPTTTADPVEEGVAAPVEQSAEQSVEQSAAEPVEEGAAESVVEAAAEPGVGQSDDDEPGQEEVDVAVHVPQFAALQDSCKNGGAVPPDRFGDVNITVWAELGRIEMPIRELLQLGDGTVLKLNRPVAQPVDLVAQGVRLARGEVVVVDDYFAIRVTEIERPTEKM